MRKLTIPVLLLGLVAALPAGAAQPANKELASEEKPADTIERGAQLVIDGLRAFFSSIPQYEAPEVLPNGDIIIRRVRPDAAEKDGDKDDGGDEEDGKGLKL